MRLSIQMEQEADDNPDVAVEENNKLLLSIHKQFPEAVWEKDQHGFMVFI